jgi:hypothetical protein
LANTAPCFPPLAALCHFVIFVIAALATCIDREKAEHSNH